MGSAVIFSGTKVKTLKSAIDLNGGNDIISSTTDPTASATSANVGSLLLNSSNGKLYRKNDSGSSTNWTEVGASGQAGINYISNPNAATNTTGWSTYAESDSVTFTDTGDVVGLTAHGLSNGTAISFSVITSTTGISVNTLYYVVNATANDFQVSASVGGSALALTTNGTGTLLRSLPKEGTGGTANITWTRSTTTPLRGAADFEFDKDAANRMGQGVATDFTIDNADLAKVLTITFDCEVVSGTYAAGDLTVYLVQDPASTKTKIQPAGYIIQAGSVGTKVRYIATFQTDSTIKSYRLCIHASTVSASAYVVAVETVVVGPQVVQYGAPVTDWVSYTPTFTGFGTATSVEVQWRRVGADLEVAGKFTSGTCTATEARVSLPSGLTSFAIPSIRISGVYLNGTSTSSKGGAVLIEPSVTYVTFGGADTFSNATLNPLAKANGTSVCSNTTPFTFQFSIPIAGWSSTVVMSSDTDTRVVAAIVTGDPASASSGNPIIVPTVGSDTHAAYNATTGRYTCPVPGYYKLFGSLQSASSATTLTIYKNASVAQLAGSLDSNGEATFSGMVFCNAGDLIDIRPGGTVDATNMALNFMRLSGPSAIAAQDTVAARYTSSAAPTITDNTYTRIDFATKVFDTTNSVTTGASWAFTAPVQGKYQVNSKVTVNYVNNTSYTAIKIQKNLVDYSVSQRFWMSTTTTNPSVAVISDIVDCVAGDTITIWFLQNTAGNRALTATATENTVSIVRVGN